MGRLDNECFLEDIRNIIDLIDIRYIVLNLSEVSNVSLNSIGHIIKYHNEILKKKKHLFICDTSKRKNRLFQNAIPEVCCELEAFSLI